MFYSSNLHNNQ
jgi:hypothetical protein